MSAFFEVAFRIAYYQMIVIMVLMPWIFRQSKKIMEGEFVCQYMFCCFLLLLCGMSAWCC